MHVVRDLLTPHPLVEPDEPAPARRRRQHVVVATLVVGTAALGATLAAPRGSLAFTLLGFLVAGVWLAGSVVAGPPTAGPSPPPRPTAQDVAAAVVLGGVAFAAFVAASLVARQIPALDGAVDSVSAKAEAGPTALVLVIAVVNAVAEEQFFRGALPAALPGAVVGTGRAVLATVVYVVVTGASLNIALVLAAVVMGTLLMVERLATGGTLAPALTHVTWSILMILVFPT
jgi:membrane protease YdiL (CAAX protease family)